MLEVVGDLWTYPADVQVITTNGTIKKNGECVMGRGCAFEAKQKWPKLPKVLGDSLRKWGNKVQYFEEFNLFVFPVKHEWYQQADPTLIVTSAIELQERALQSWNTIVMPRPGCGNGKLEWKYVRELLKPILDDRFHVIHNGK